jgi:hypothetical protein
MAPQAPLFQPFRALGYITDNVPFAVQRRGKETYVTVSVGKAWQVGEGFGRRLRPVRCAARLIVIMCELCMQVYNCSKLTLVLVGPQVRVQCIHRRLLHASCCCCSLVPLHCNPYLSRSCMDQLRRWHARAS